MHVTPWSRVRSPPGALILLLKLSTNSLYQSTMGRKEEVIIRPAVGIILGISITAFLTAISNDIVAPILKQKSFDDEERTNLADAPGDNRGTLRAVDQRR